jgi:cobalt-precorrin 5A hydrolase
MIALGLGCREGCAPGDLLAAVSGALAQAGQTLAAVQLLCAPDWKRDEPALELAARKLGKPLCWLSLAELQAQSAAAITHSERVQQQFGLPSVAETAALAGACRAARAPHAVRLLAARLIAGGATCALAQTSDALQPSEADISDARPAAHDPQHASRQECDS